LKLVNETLLDSGAVTLNTDWESRPIYLGHIAQYAIQIVFTGTPEGIFKLQCSNDSVTAGATLSSQASNVVNWTDITGSESMVSEDGNITWNAENVGYAWVRVVYSFDTSTGTLTSAVANLKGI
jgi:hypothetical protein